MRQPPDVFKWPLNGVVVRSGGRTVLIDAGMGAEYPAGGLLAGRLEAAGTDPASVTDVVLTHMHVDHVGGLLADGLRGRLRPDVPIHLAAAEVEFWASPDFSRSTFAGMPDVLRSAAMALRGKVPQPTADVRVGVRGGAGGRRRKTRTRSPPPVRMARHSAAQSAPAPVAVTAACSRGERRRQHPPRPHRPSLRQRRTPRLAVAAAVRFGSTPRARCTLPRHPLVWQDREGRIHVRGGGHSGRWRSRASPKHHAPGRWLAKAASSAASRHCARRPRRSSAATRNSTAGGRPSTARAGSC